MTTRSAHLNKGLARLKEEQNKGLWQCLENISKWTKFKLDYEQLKSKLDTLADKIDYDIMVPFGSVAFMPGKLVHTNEIMVLLGENWFAERSAKQASEVVARRITKCENTLAQFEKEREQFEKWMSSTEKVQEEVGGDVLDIVEECDESEERAWQEKHRQNVKKYHQNKKNMEPLEKDGETDEEYWNRLEMSETGNNEIENMIDEEDEDDESDIFSSEEDETETSSSDNESNEQTQKRKSVQFLEDVPVSNSKSTCNVPTVKIKFTEGDSSTSTSHESVPANTVRVIQSPSDIYKHFSANNKPQPLKSILKSSLTPGVYVDPPEIPSTLESDNALLTSEQTENKAFSGVIVERGPLTYSQDSKDSTCPARRVSKFKERQMRRK